MDDLISRQVAIDALVKAIREDPYYDSDGIGLSVCDVRVILNDLPSAQSEQNNHTVACLHAAEAFPEWNNHTVACLLAEVFDDTCACNHNGIDEWLPEKCELLDSCPHPAGVACWEQFLKHKAERRTDE